MCAASEGVYRIAGVPPGEILFHIAAQPECLVCLRSGGLAVPPHKAVSVQKEKTKGKGEARSQDADRLYIQRGILRSVLWNRYHGSAVSETLSTDSHFQSNFPRRPQFMTGTTVQAPLRFAEIQQEIKKRRRKSFTGSFRHSWKRE